MSSEESLTTRLRPGVTTKLIKSKGTTNIQDDLKRLIDPDLDDNDLQGILVSLTIVLLLCLPSPVSSILMENF